MIEVAFCAYDKPDSIGGPLTWLSDLLPALRERGIESRCLFLTHWGGTGPYLDRLRSQGFGCEQAACHDHTRDRVRWILSKLADDPPDIFVPNLVIAAYFASRWVRRAGIPTLGVLHSDDPFYRAIQEEFVFGRKEYRLTALACVSRALEKQLIGRAPVSTTVHRVPYGVRLPSTTAQRIPGRLRLAYVGRLAEEQKRVSELTHALCRVVREVEGTEAVLYGDGPDRANVEAILAQEGLGSVVELAGRIPSEEVPSALLGSDVLVLLSDYEGLPIAALEAMACGVVPVCLRMRSGIPELIEDGVTGLVVDDRQQSFVDAIARLRNEPALWERLSRGARARVAAEYSREASVERWADLVFELHERSGEKRPIRMPGPLRLPPVNPRLASADPRPVGESRALRLVRSGRMLAGRLRRRLMGQPVP